MTSAEALAKYVESMQGKARAAFYVAIVRRFLATRAPLTHEALTTYLTGLAREMHPSSVDLHSRTLQRFCTVAGLAYPGTSWKWNRKAAPSSRLAAGPDLVEALVAASAHTGRRARAWLVLSTIYGCRAAELALFTQQDLAVGAVFIHRVKGGEPRWYWVPPAIQPLLAGVAVVAAKAGEPYEDWHELLKAAGVVMPRSGRGEAWHSIRRSLVAMLRQRHVPGDVVHRFIAWSGEADEGDMMRLYGRPTGYVGADGEVSAAPVAQPAPDDLRAVDAAVWRQHPYLRLWSA